MNVKEEIRSQIIGVLSAAKFPIYTREELQDAMPAGADACCEVGNVRVTAEDAGYLLEDADFPLSSAEQVADTIVERVGL